MAKSQFMRFVGGEQKIGDIANEITIVVHRVSGIGQRW